MIKFLYFLVFTFFFYSTIFSQESDTTESQTESWYYYQGFGYPMIFTYPSDIQEILDSHIMWRSQSSYKVSINFGIYIHITPKTIGGVIFNAAHSKITTGEGSYITAPSYDIRQIIYGLSVLHFFGRAFGSGTFIRADMGLGEIWGDKIVQISPPFDPSEPIKPPKTDYIDPSGNGIGILVGGGLSFDLGGTRLLLNANYAYTGVDSGACHTLGLSIGGLF
jgi:hypothetical protein